MSAAHLPIWLDGPLQSWGFASRFQRRTTGLFPTKSGLLGMVCAAMGLAKGSGAERELLIDLGLLKLTAWQFPRLAGRGEKKPLLVQRLEDFHTVLGTRRASGKMNTDPVITRRQYLLEARFGILLSGDADLLDRVAGALRDPVWGIWLGRKSCVPAAPVCPEGPFASIPEAWAALLRAAGMPEGLEEALFAKSEEVSDFAEGTDTFNDQPLSFGTADSSGVDGRAFAPRRVRVTPGSGVDGASTPT